MTYRSFGIQSAGIVIFVAISSCSVAPAGVDIHDPNEAHNREVHAFNKRLNARLNSFRPPPTSDAPVTASIDPVLTKPVVNFAENLEMPGIVLNGLLQGNFEGAAKGAMRFVVNSTVGVLGLFDPASAMGLEQEGADFGQTLSVWGATEGAYIELPVLGPTNERDLAGTVVDALLDPLGFVLTPEQGRVATGAGLAALGVKRSQLSGAIDSVYDSADSYEQQKLIYYQNRRFDLGAEMEDVDPYFELYGE